MNCAECKELLVEYYEGLLDDSLAHAVVEHLGKCPSCSKEAKEIGNLHKRLVTNGKGVSQSNLENEVMNQIIRKQKIQLKQQRGSAKTNNIWRIIMSSKMTKLAVAAVVLIAVGIGFHFVGNPIGPTVAFTKVVEPILTCRSIVYDSLMGDEATSPIIHDIVLIDEQRIRRTISNLPGMTHIIDAKNSKMLILMDADKTAAYVDIQGPLLEKTQGYVQFLRHIITEQKDNYEEFGEQQIEGREAVVFKAGGPNEGVKIWADPYTALPIRIELGLGQIFVIMKNFQFDPLIDESLMSTDVPAGYQLKQDEIDLSSATEQDFLESLRIWAEVIGDGTFPEAIGTENAMKQMPLLVEKIGKMDLSEEQGSQLGISFGKGMLFHQNLEFQGRWEYKGGGVELGGADTAILWYQPEGSETWRVIYGDLHVEDVAQENLPQ